MSNKMRNSKSLSEDIITDEIAWPEMYQIESNGKAQIKYANDIFYRRCTICESQSGKNLRQLDDYDQEFYNSQEYLQFLEKNQNVQVTLIPSSQSSQEKLGFKWAINQLKNDQMILELEFTNPEMISIYPEKDILQISFFNTHQFMLDKN